MTTNSFERHTRYRKFPKKIIWKISHFANTKREEITSKTSKAAFCQKLAFFFKIMKKSSKCKDYYLHSTKLYKEKKMYKEIVGNLRRMAGLYSSQNRNVGALMLLCESLKNMMYHRQLLRDSRKRVTVSNCEDERDGLECDYNEESTACCVACVGNTSRGDTDVLKFLCAVEDIGDDDEYDDDEESEGMRALDELDSPRRKEALMERMIGETMEQILGVFVKICDGKMVKDEFKFLDATVRSVFRMAEELEMTPYIEVMFHYLASFSAKLMVKRDYFSVHCGKSVATLLNALKGIHENNLDEDDFKQAEKAYKHFSGIRSSRPMLKRRFSNRRLFF